MAEAMAAGRQLVVEARPDSPRAWTTELWRHRAVLGMLARADFHVRYKRASFGVAWAVIVPLVQAAVIAIVFSRIVRLGTGSDFTVYVLSGVLPWSYFAQTVTVGSTSIVDGAGLSDKVWFPRALLPIVPSLANTVGLVISLVVLLGVMPLLGADIGRRVVLLVPAVLMLVGFTVGLTMTLSALHVYFRDVRFLVQAVMMVWFYITPIAYPPELLGRLETVIDLNPMTGVVTMFRMATLGVDDGWQRPVLIALLVTVTLLVVGAEAQRRHDRLFVDLL